jgi:NADPH-dependent 2,4-dienoyl-CoA reductase/sulfur reductase-like enzyme/rhodanese-related sulfurtransferase/two-component sensor histidine kinase
MENKPRSDHPQSDIDGLIRVLSHQLKSPINAIESMLSVIADGFTGDVDSKTLHYIRKAAGKAQDARDLITNLLRYEQYGTMDERERERIELAGLVETIAGSYRVTAAEKNISLQVDLPDNVTVTVMGQKGGLESAIRNLMDNAVKYTPEHGTIGVTLAVAEGNRRCELSIRDSGCGISADDQQNLFTPFFRSAASKGSVSGTGLGLAIVKRVVEGHDGTIAVASSPNAGSTFTIALPCETAAVTAAASRPRKRVVIVGGVTAGPKAAARLRRLDEDADITIVEQSEFLSYAGCGIPSYVRGTVKSPKALMSTADNTLRDVNFFETIKNIRILNRTEAIAIDRKARELRLRSLADKREWSIPYDVLVLATGAASVVPPIPGIDAPEVYSLYSIEDAEAIKRQFAERPASDVCILGGGLVGIEIAESLLLAGGRVTVLERDDRILKLFDRDIAIKITSALNMKGIKVVTGVSVVEVKHERGQQTIVTDRGVFAADIIILSAGVKPNTALAVAAGLETGANGAIKVNEYLQTSDPAIYAIGDCAESRHLVTGKYSYLPLGSISTKMGRIAADNIFGRKVVFPGSIGTTMFKIFDIQVARTGLEMDQAHCCGFDPVSAVVSGLDRAHYEVNAQHVVIKIVADRNSGRLLGAQGYGRGDVASRISMLGAAISRGLTLHEVFTLDLGYYPAFNNPIDLAQTACLVLRNKIDGMCPTIELEEFERDRGTLNVVDVSPHQEHEFAAIPGSVNVPLENLRQEGIPFALKDPVVLYSKTSSRAYEASLILRAAGYEQVRILEGGYVFWKR